jgi:hypothetical protein
MSTLDVRRTVMAAASVTGPARFGVRGLGDARVVREERPAGHIALPSRMRKKTIQPGTQSAP